MKNVGRNLLLLLVVVLSGVTLWAFHGKCEAKRRQQVTEERLRAFHTFDVRRGETQ